MYVILFRIWESTQQTLNMSIINLNQGRKIETLIKEIIEYISYGVLCIFLTLCVFGAINAKKCFRRSKNLALIYFIYILFENKDKSCLKNACQGFI